MPFYVWWAIPLVATVLAVAFLSWRSRERRIDPHDSVAARRRFEEALAEPPATRNQRRQGRPGEAPAASPADIDDDADHDAGPAAEPRRGTSA